MAMGMRMDMLPGKPVPGGKPMPGGQMQSGTGPGPTMTPQSSGGGAERIMRLIQQKEAELAALREQYAAALQATTSRGGQQGPPNRGRPMSATGTGGPPRGSGQLDFLDQLLGRVGQR